MDTLIAGISGGIGLALARHRLEQHNDGRVIGLSRHPGDEPALQELRASFPERLVLITADVTDAEGLAEALRQRLPADTDLRSVIFAIGVLHDDAMSPEKRLEDVDAGAMLHSYRVNTLGFLLLVQAAVPWLRHREPKLIAAISAKVGSIGDNGLGGWYGYRCSKAALNMAVRNLAVETRRRMKPTTVVALHPGTTQTPLSEPFEQSLARLSVHSPSDTAANLWRVLDNLGAEDSGSFINWDGSTLPW